MLSKAKYSEAIIKFNLAISKNPYYKEAYNKLGITYYQNKEYKNAITSFKKAISLDNSYTEAYNNLGLAYEMAEMVDDAIKSYRIAIKQDPTNPEFHYNLASGLYKKGQIFSSIKEYKKTIEIESGFYSAYIKLGDIYWNDKKMKEEAIMFYEDAKAKNPKSHLPHLGLGRLYFQTQELDKAIWEYKKAIQKNKEPIDELRELGNIYIEKKDYKGAKNLYKRLLSLKPEDKVAKYSLGLIYEKMGNFNNALSMYEDGLKIEKENEILQFSKERAISLLNEPTYSDVRKECSFLHLKLAEDYLKKGMISLAIYEYKRAISLNPQDPKIRLSLARIYEKREMFSNTENELIKVIELEPTNIQASDMAERINFKKKKTITYQEKIDEIPKPELRLIFFTISKCPLVYPDSLNYLNYLLETILSYSKKLSLIIPQEFSGDKKKAIEKAKENGADFLLFVEVEENEQMIKTKAILINIENLKEDVIISKGSGNNRLKEVIYYLSQKTEELLPIKAKIFKIEGGDAFINAGSLCGIKEGDIFEVLEKRKSIGKIKIIKASPEISKAIVIPPQTKEILKIKREVRR